MIIKEANYFYEVILLKFYDCRVRYGSHIAGGSYTPCHTIDDLVKTIRNAGLSGAIVYSYMTDTAGVIIGNDNLRKDIARQKTENPDIELIGAYTIVPSCTNETVQPDELPAFMKENGFGVIRLNPSAHKYLCVSHTIGDYLQMANDKKIPVLLDAGPTINHDTGMTLEQADGILRDFPELTAILYYDNVWPNDRFIRPLLKQYKNLCLNTAHFVVDGAYEECVEMFGDARFMHGSCFPDMYMACGVLSIVHAEIPEESKQAIASGNLLRVVKGWVA